MAEETRPMIREAVAVFDDSDKLQAAVDELMLRGRFDRPKLSIMAGDETVRDRLGNRFGIQDAKDDPNVPRASYVAPEEMGNAQGALMGALAYVGAVAAGGAIVLTGGTLLAGAAAAAVAGGAGGAVGSVFAKWLGQQQSDYLEKQLEKGGILLWVNVADADEERKAREILSRHSAEPVEVHEIPAPGPTAEASTRAV